MNARSLFVSSDGRLRALWRILVFILVAIACIEVLAVVATPAMGGINRLFDEPDAAAAIIPMFGFLAAHAIMLRHDKRTWAYVALDRDAARPRVLGGGWLLGALAILAPSLLLYAAGWLAIRPSPDASWWLSAGRISLLLLLAALSEELFSRGYIFAVLRESLGWPFALGLTSLAFGLLHLGNPGADARSVGLVTLAGLFLGAVVIVSRSLYAAWMTHAAWNWAMAVLLHTAVSGKVFRHPDYQMVDNGPNWLTGGAWGPEGGAASAGGMLVGLGYLYWRFTKKNHEQLQQPNG